MADKFYIVRVSRYLTYPAYAESPEAAKEKAWDCLKHGYTYGYEDRADFMSRVKVTQGVK